MTVETHPNFIDVTAKEGGFRIHHHFLLEQVANLARELQRSKIEYAEISHGRGIGAKKAGYPALHSDKEILKTAKQAAPDLNLCIYLSTYPYSLMALDPLKDWFDLGRVGVNVHETEKAGEFISKLKSFKKTVIAQLIRVHARDIQETVAAAENLEGMGADVIYLTDSFGSMSPAEVTDYFLAVKDKIKLPLGFQGKNNTSRAVPNTLAAWQAGAKWLDGSLMGMGQGAGMTPLEILVSVLQREGQCDHINLVELCNAANSYVQPAFRSIPFPSYIDLLLAKHKMDYYPQELLERIADILDISLEEFLTRLRKVRRDLVQLRQEDLKILLAQENLDFDVVMEYLKTGRIPNVSEPAKSSE